MSDATVMEKIVSLCKRRGFVYPAGEIYGGINGFWDYGPLGVLLKNNIRDSWWRAMVECPPIGPDGLVGMHPPRIDHIFLMCEDVNGATDFFRDVLGFRMTEQILADDGYQLATFMERSHSTHDIAFLTGPDGGFHHVAFWVDDWNELRHAADTCAYHGITVDAGPTRHGATRGCGLYFFDPAGNRNELYTGGYWFDPDDAPTTWTESEIGRAIFYYQGKLNPSFMTTHS